MKKSIKIGDKTYSVRLVKEVDEYGNESQAMLLENGEEVYRLSPNTTDEELSKYADPNEKGHEL